MTRAVVNLSKDVSLVAETCATCGIDYAVPDWVQQQRRRDGAGLYCPMGHASVYSPSEVAQLRHELDAIQLRLAQADDQRMAAQRDAQAAREQLAAATGQMDKLKRRVGNGVCPCCKRSFVHLQRHMNTKHPNYAGDTP